MATAFDNIAATIANAAARLAEIDALTIEQRVRFTYQDGDQSYDWNAYRASLMQILTNGPQMLAGAQAAAGPFTVIHCGGW